MSVLEDPPLGEQIARAARARELLRSRVDCDLCVVRGSVACPGFEVHCGQGEHCWATDASCAVSTRTDPCSRCCSCRADSPYAS